MMRGTGVACSLILGIGMAVGAGGESLATTYLVPTHDYSTIQAGIDAAAFGDTVLVEPGVYTDFETRVQVGGGTWTACAFMKDGVVVKSSGGPDVTIIDTDKLGGPSAYGINARFLASTATSLEGFTLLGDGAGIGMYIWLCGNFTVRDCKFIDFNAGQTAGGAIIGVGNKSIVDSDFINCRGFGAGAIWATSGNLELIRCTFRECSNGAVYVDQPGEQLLTSATIEDCTFIDNFSNEAGGGGLVISVAGLGASIRGCYFQNNVCYANGSGALGFGTGPRTVEYCVFVDNGALSGFGGALHTGGTTGTIRNNTFVGNYKLPGSAPGATVVFFGPVSFENNIVAGSEGGGAVGNYGGATTSCNVFWDNPQGAGVPLSSTDRVIDPRFCDATVNDFTLELGSPCLPDDSLGCGLIGALEQGCGAVSVESKSWGQIKGLYRGYKEAMR